MSGSDIAPRYETRHEFTERIIRRFAERRVPDKVAMNIVRPLLVGYAPFNPTKLRNVMAQVCETEQDRHSFRVHYLGVD